VVADDRSGVWSWPSASPTDRCMRPKETGLAPKAVNPSNDQDRSGNQTTSDQGLVNPSVSQRVL
jgi:hypothetical protein